MDVSIQKIIEVVAAHFDYHPAVLTGKSRIAEHVNARQLAMTLAHKRGHSYAEIGRAFSKHHTSVMAGIESYQNRMAVWPSLFRLAAKLDASLTQQQTPAAV
jgi:chromosomal replication initiation ATPase DnaA